MPFYSLASTNGDNVRFQDICNEVFKTDHLSSSSAQGRPGRNILNNAVSQVDNGKVNKAVDNHLYKPLDKRQHVSPGSYVSPLPSGNTELCNEPVLQESFEQELITPLKSSLTCTLGAECSDFDDVRGQRREHTTSQCSSYSTEDSVIAQSRCSVCDGCSSSVESSHSVPALFGFEDVPLVHPTTTSTCQASQRNLLSHTQEDTLPVNGSFDQHLSQFVNNVTEMKVTFSILFV